MSFRPITDTWILGRPKVPYYGSYPCGFLGRARDLLGVTLTDPVLHVCGGRARDYSRPEFGVTKGVGVRGFGPNDKTLDLDPALTPDYLQDCRKPLPGIHLHRDGAILGCSQHLFQGNGCVCPWPAILADPPYSEEDATHYGVGARVYPKPGEVLRNCLKAVRPGGRVGILHYLWPKEPPESIGFKTRPVACITIYVGQNNRGRCFSVFERLP